jgi:hypothetical protein
LTPRKSQELKNKFFLAGALFVSGALFLSFKPFVLAHPGLIAVLVGVSGEVFFDWKEEKGAHSALKKFFMALLVVGLTYELYEASESDKKAADAMKLAAKSELQAEILTAQNLKLQTDLAKLRQQRWLVFNDQAFANALKDSPKMDVQIWYPPHDPESGNLVNLELKDALQHAGWNITEIRQFEPAYDFDSESSTPISVRMGSNSESVEILVNSHDFWKTVGDVWSRDDIQTAPKSLAKAFDASGAFWMKIIPQPSFPNLENGVVIDVPTNTIRIIVFPKQF